MSILHSPKDYTILANADNQPEGTIGYRDQVGSDDRLRRLAGAPQSCHSGAGGILGGRSPTEVVDTAPPHERSRQAMRKLSRNRQLFERTERRLRSKAASRMDQAVKHDLKFLSRILQNLL
jgi:hypothetical protein